jgi:serine/threonine protein kinase
MAPWNPKANAIFLEALEIAGAEQRQAYLDQACGEDTDLRGRVGALLAANEHAGSFLESPASGLMETLEELPLLEGPGTVIGPYRLLQPIGEGGMGVVFLAEQQHPVHRQVALKVIKPGMDTRQVIARFEAERQTLAMMDHLHIARVLDGGATDTGRPFFVMELVQGVPLTKYCDEHQLTLMERLELFVPVCQAIQHAHHKGIIHRDVKPSNILVTKYDGRPVPKVIDFGVAKATEKRLTEQTLSTQVGAIVGTLEYMSPEQAEQSPQGVDTRSDIYSLGVLLYELLTGTTPLDRKRRPEAGVNELLRIIKEEVPPKPSMRLANSDSLPAMAGAARRTEPARLIRLVRGDLDWIVMKALAKDRNERYATAQELAEDVKRFLDDRPVQARPPTFGDRIRKWTRRHRAIVWPVAVALFVVPLIALGLMYLHVTRLAAEREQTQKARDRAEENLEDARQVVDSMLTRVGEGLAKQPRMQKMRKQLLEEALQFYQRFLQQKANDPRMRAETARAMWRVGSIHYLLGQMDLAEKDYLQGVDFLQNFVKDGSGELPYHNHLASCHNGLANVYLAMGQHEKAREAIKKAIALRREFLAVYPNDRGNQNELAVSFLNLGRIFQDLDDLKQAEAANEDGLHVLQNGQSELPKEPAMRNNLAKLHHNLAMIYERTNRAQDAETAYLKAVDVERALVQEYPDEMDYQDELAKHYINLGYVYAIQVRVRQAEEADQEAQKIWEKLAREQPDVPEYRAFLAMAYFNLGALADRNGESEKAEAEYQQAISLRQTLRRDFPDIPRYRHELAEGLNNLGAFFLDAHQKDKAREPIHQARDLREELARDYPAVTEYQVALAQSHNNTAIFDLADNPDQAIVGYKKALTVWEALIKRHPTELEYIQNKAASLCNIGEALQKLGKAKEAIEWYDQAASVLEEVLAKQPKEPAALRFYDNTCMGRASALAEVHEYERAQRELDKLLKRKSLPAEMLYDMACAFSICAGAAGQDKSLAEAERHALSDKYAAQACELLRRVAKTGWFKDAARVAHMKQDQDLDALRSRDQFREFMRDIESALPPSKPAKEVGK